MAFFDRFVQTSWTYAALALFVFIAAVPGLVRMPAMDRDESRFSQATAQMLESGDYVVINYHDHMRNKKPVGIHWMQAAAVALTSSAEARDIGAFRLPSLLGAMMAAMAAFWGGSALFGRRAAFIGAAVLGSCLLLTTEAHIAKTDAAQCGVLTLAMAALAQMRAGPGRWKGVIFWVCLAVGVLLKGPIAPMIAGLTIGSLFLWERKFEWARPLLYWVGPSLFCIIAIPWFIAVQIATGGEFLFEAVAVDLAPKIVSAAEGHDGPPGMHLAALPLLFWPGTLLLIPGIWLAASTLLGMSKTQKTSKASKTTSFADTWSEHELRSWRFLACWIVPSWIVFEIAPTKLFHYTLPLYPAFALMAGAAADKWFSTNTWKQGRWPSIILFGLVTLVFAILPSPWVLAAIRADSAAEFGPFLSDRVAWIWTQAWNATGVGLWPTIFILLAGGATIYATIKREPLYMLGGILMCSLIGGISYRAFILPGQTWMLATEASLSALKDLCAFPEGTARWTESGCEGRAPKVVHAIDFAEPSFVFELGGKVTLPPDSKPVIPPIAEDNRPAWLINIAKPTGAEALATLTKAASAADRCIRFSRRYAFNYSNGDPSALVAVVVEPAGCPSTGAPPPELRSTQDEEDVPELVK
jgi:hypothetical protein